MPDRQPNLLFVFPDQMRHCSMGFLGQDPVLTPRLDAFARESLHLSHALSNNPVCSPYRAMLQTGLYPPASGVSSNCNSAPKNADEYLRQDAVTLTDVLARAGYDVGYIGKWHLEKPFEPYVMKPGGDGVVWNEWTPPERRHSVRYWHAYNTYDNHFAPEYWIQDAGRDQRRKVDAWSPIHEVDTASAFIANEGGGYRDDDKPWACFVSMNPPHTPFQLVPEDYLARYGDATPDELLVRPNVDPAVPHGPGHNKPRDHVKNHFAQVTGVDDQFGRLLDLLAARGEVEDTLVVFTSDHGEMMGSQGRMHKSVWYEESLRVPFLARFPGRLAAGASDDLLLSAPDIPTTLYGLLGIADHAPDGLHGRDWSATLRGESEARPDHAVYLNGDRGGLRTARHTYAAERVDGAVVEHLYDNLDDPYQLRDLVAEQPGLCAELRNHSLEDLRAIGYQPAIETLEAVG